MWPGCLPYMEKSANNSVKWVRENERRMNKLGVLRMWSVVNCINSSDKCFLSVLCRYDSNSGGEREIQRTMLELLNQLDGFDSRGDVKVIMATNRIETLDPALIRPGQSEWV